MRDGIKHELPLSTVESIAKIVGDGSACAHALSFADERGGRKQAAFYQTYSGVILVVPFAAQESNT